LNGGKPITVADPSPSDPQSPDPLAPEPVEYPWLSPDKPDGAYLWFPGPLPEGTSDGEDPADDEAQDHFEVDRAKLTEEDREDVQAIAKILRISMHKAKELIVQAIEFCGREITSAAIGDVVKLKTEPDDGVGPPNLVAAFIGFAEKRENEHPEGPGPHIAEYERCVAAGEVIPAWLVPMRRLWDEPDADEVEITEDEALALVETEVKPKEGAQAFLDAAHEHYGLVAVALALEDLATHAYRGQYPHQEWGPEAERADPRWKGGGSMRLKFHQIAEGLAEDLSMDRTGGEADEGAGRVVAKT
jgi:hypothetical protein